MVTLYTASIPPMIKSCRNLKAILTKAQLYCTNNNIDPKTMTSYRLIKDMLPLSYQVTSACDTIKFLLNRVGGANLPAVEDTEETFEELQARIDSTLDKISTVSPTSMDAIDDDTKIIVATRSSGTFTMSAHDYVFQYAIPNFHFHLTTAYCIIRQQGVVINTFDYLDTDKSLFIKA